MSLEKKDSKIMAVKGADSNTSHSFSEEEKVAFTDYINQALKNDPDVGNRLPINSKDNSLFTSVKDGMIMCKLINDAIPGTIDERVLTKKNPNTFQIHENQTVAIQSAKSIGCNIINIGPSDLIEGRTHLVLGLIWQIVKIGLFSRINLVNHPELYRLLEDGETIEDLLALPIEQILLRWFNYHLKNANWNRRVKNFTSDIKDGENYAVLLAQIAPKHCNRDPLNESDLSKRAELVLQNADKLECRKFVTPKDIVKGHPKLNLAFVANLFNTWPALEPLEEEIEIIEETREEKQYRNWMNSNGADPFVKNLYLDLRNGLILLQLEDMVRPGIVDWKKVKKNPTNKFMEVANCNYAIDIAKEMKLSCVGIGGSDIQAGNKTLTLAVVWQLMRAHLISILEKLGGGQKISDADIIAWANDKIKSAENFSDRTMSGWRDKSLCDSKFFLGLESAIKAGSINFDLVGSNNLENASLCVSSARKIGATVFTLPEDITEGKDKQILAFTASLMAVDKQ